MARTRRARRKQFQVEHHHMLLRLETKTCPGPEDTQMVQDLFHAIVHDIHMKPLGPASVYYVADGPGAGMTGIMPIQTSHISFHFWNSAAREILHAPASRCLLQMDIYTCGTLTKQQIGTLLHHLTRFKPTHMECTVLNRNRGLTIQRHMVWEPESGAWSRWVDSRFGGCARGCKA